MVTRAALPQELVKKKNLQEQSAAYSAFIAPCPVVAIILSWQLRPSNLIAMILELQQGPFEGMSGKGAMPPNTAVKAHGPLPVTPAKCFWWAHTHVHGGTKERGICWVFGCDLFKMCSLCPLIQLSKDLLQQLLFSLFPFTSPSLVLCL